jgi:hypothetical protein
MKSFQDFADETGITTRFRMSNRSLGRFTDIFDEWRAQVPPSARERGRVIRWQRVPESKSIRMTLSSGAVFEIRLRK